MSAEAIKLCPKRSNAHNVSQTLAPQLFFLSEDSGDYSMYNMTGSPVQPLKITVIVNGANFEMEVDTRASASIISEQTYNQLWPQGRRPKLQPTAVKLCTYSGEQLTVKGVISVEVQYNGQSGLLSLIVASGRGPSPLGRDWLTKIRLDWTHLWNNHLCYCVSLQGILADYSTVFNTELRTLKGFTATICVDPAAQTGFCKSRAVP